MAKAELKTKLTDADVEDFLKRIDDEQQRADSFKLLEMFGRATGEKPKMWGPAIIGFGQRRLKYDSGRELDWMITGFSPRKANLSLYILNGSQRCSELLLTLGKHKTGKGCLYIRRLADVDLDVLAELVSEAAKNGGGV